TLGVLPGASCTKHVAFQEFLLSDQLVGFLTRCPRDGADVRTGRTPRRTGMRTRVVVTGPQAAAGPKSGAGTAWKPVACRRQGRPQRWPRAAAGAGRGAPADGVVVRPSPGRAAWPGKAEVRQEPGGPGSGAGADCSLRPDACFRLRPPPS